MIAFFGFKVLSETDLFFGPGEVHYDDSLTAEDLEVLKGIFTDEVRLKRDVTISAWTSDSKPKLNDGEYLYEITVPVTDFMDSRSDTNEFDKANYIPLEELESSKKLLSVNGDYFLDTFDKGANYRVIKFDSVKFNDEIEPLVDSAFYKDWPSSSSVLTFAQTGVTALGRGMNVKLNAVEGNAGYFAEKVKDYLSSFDLTHTSNEASFSEMANSENICSDSRFIDTLKAIGLDIVELTGNHNVDCGSQAAISTIDTYQNNGIKIVGGGKNADDAATPLELDKKGNKITMLAYNLSTGGATVDDTPGANQYEETKVANDIKTAKEHGNFVIVDMQYYECSAYASEVDDPTCDRADSAAGDQIGVFRHLIDLGADIVVGTSAHQPQTFEVYNNRPIYYGLGNLFFDQVWWPGTTRSLVLAHYFYNGKLLQTKIVPTVYDESMQVRLMDNDEAKSYIERLKSVSPGF